MIPGMRAYHVVNRGIQACSPAWYTEELHLDDGFYGLDGLEYAIAKLIRQSSASAPSYVYEKDTQTLGTNLWDTMDTMVQANAFSYQVSYCV
jgi:hypothetical protein